MDNPFSEIRILSQHTDIVRFLVCIDDFRCCSAGDDGLVIVWNFKNGKLVHALKGHARPITAIIPMCRPRLNGCESNDWLLVSASSDKLILIWDVESGQILRKFTEHCSTAKCLDAMPGYVGFFCSGGERLCVWDVIGLRLVHLIPSMTIEDVHLILAMPNNVIVAGADRLIAVFFCDDKNGDLILKHGHHLDEHRESIRSLIKVDDVSFASGSLDGAIYHWSIGSLDILRRFNYTPEYDSHIYPSSVQHMICIENKFLVCAIGSGFSIFDLSSGEIILEKSSVHDGKVLCIQAVFYDSLFATCSEDGTIKLWGNSNILRGELPDDDSPSASPHKAGPLTTGFLSNFSHGKPDKLVVRKIGVCTAHSGSVQCCLSLPFGRFMSTGMDTSIILWMDGLAECCKRDRLIRDALFRIKPHAQYCALEL